MMKSPGHGMKCFTSTIIAALFLVASPASAQYDLVGDRFDFSEGVERNAGITSPASFLGYSAGEQFTFHHDVVDYLNLLADESDRVTLHSYGETYEGRSLQYLIVTSADNHARIDEIRANNLMLARGRDLSNEDAGSIIETNPTVVWLSYNVHGNEASSTEAALEVAYRMASDDSPEMQRILSESIVILDPTMNPDGRDRYVYWYRSAANNLVNTNAADLEHDEPWPGGRTNHYWFDLNRDWLWLVHPESRGRIKAYQEWLPQVHVDYHEQGFNSNYFTMPGTTPRNLEIPEEYDTWAARFGEANTKAFDEHSITYATREAFDFFYPGYGSSYPTNMGAIGMLTEQGGHSRGGRAVKTADDYVLTLRQRIFDHYLTSFATIRTSVERRRELLQYYRDFFVPDEGSNSVYIYPDDNGNGHLYRMLGILDSHGVQIFRTVESANANNVRSYRDGRSLRRDVPAGAFVIPADQPRSVFVNTVLKQDLALEDSVTYDMTSWSMPLAYNIDGYWKEGRSGLNLEPVNQVPAVNGSYNAVDNPYAAVIDWQQANAPGALAQLWEKKYKVRSVKKEFTLGGRRYGPGTLVVLMGRNLDRKMSFNDDMREIAQSSRVEIIGVASGAVDGGINLASNDSEPLPASRVALLVDSPVSSYSAGQIWYMFDQDIGFGISRIRHDDLASLRLNNYDVLIVPGFGGNMSSFTDSATVQRLRSWVSAGGVLVGLERGAEWLTKKNSGLTAVAMKKSLDAAGDSTGSDSSAIYLRYEDRERHSGLKRIPGAAFRGVVDDSHPLAFGMPSQLYSLKLQTTAIEPSDKYHMVGYYDTDPDVVLASGYASAAEKTRLAGAGFAAMQSLGSGKVVLLVDNTQYRYFWIGPSRMLVNAAMLLPGM